MSAPAWQRLADVLLQREALVCREVGEIPASLSAGLYVTDDDALRLLQGLPGLRDPRHEAVRAVHSRLADDVQGAREAFHSELGQTILGELRDSHHLRDGELELLALLVAIEAEPARQMLLGYIQDDLTRPRLMMATLGRFALDDEAALSMLHPRNALVGSRLVQVISEEPWARSQVRPSPSLVWSLLTATDPPPPRYATRLDGNQAEEPARHPEGVTVFSGSVRKRTAIGAVHAAIPGPLLHVESSDWPALDSGSSDEINDLLGYATVANATLWINLTDPPSRALRTLIEETTHHRWVLWTLKPVALADLPGRSYREIEIEEPLADEDEICRALEVESPSGHLLSSADVNAIEQWRKEVGSAATPRKAIEKLVGNALSGLAHPVAVRRSRDNLVLSAESNGRLDELIERYRFRSLADNRLGEIRSPKGIVALFAGSSGTGKTIAAEVVAHELGLALHRVDLSSMLSKYIGESEKQLARLFDASHRLPTALLFDEADAIFGKRSQVKDSHDRYANAGISYLLQRIEEHEGLTILASNLHQNIDEAFRRRIHVSIEFSSPAVEERESLWHGALAPFVGFQPHDILALATDYELPGAAVENAVLTATYRALGQSVEVDRSHVEHGIRRELQKLGRFHPSMVATQ